MSICLSICLSTTSLFYSQCHGDLTPLHIAAREGHLECLELLLQSGADFNITDFSGHTALETAKLWGKRECARRLAAFKWSSNKNNEANETVEKKIRKEYADRDRKERERSKRMWQNNLSFQGWIVSKGFSLWENTTSPTSCQDRLDCRLLSPISICRACEPPQKPPALRSVLRQSKPKAIAVSFRARKKHFQTSYLLSGIQRAERTHREQRKQTKVKLTKCNKQGHPEIALQEMTNPEVTQPGMTKPEMPIPEMTNPEVTQPEMLIPEVTHPDVIQLESDYCISPLTHSKSVEVLTSTQPVEHNGMKAKSLTMLEPARSTACETQRLGPPSLLSRRSHSSTRIHTKTCQAWGTRHIPQPNSFICVTPQSASHSTTSGATPQLVVEPRSLHTKRDGDAKTLDVASHLMKLGENSQSITRYRGYNGSL